MVTSFYNGSSLITLASPQRHCPGAVNAKNEPSGEFMGRTGELLGPAAVILISHQPIAGVCLRLAGLFKHVMEVTLWPLWRRRGQKLRRAAWGFRRVGLRQEATWVRDANIVDALALV